MELIAVARGSLWKSPRILGFQLLREKGKSLETGTLLGQRKLIRSKHYVVDAGDVFEAHYGYGNGALQGVTYQFLMIWGDQGLYYVGVGEQFSSWSGCGISISLALSQNARTT
jgi:hypothetical protein